jgi:hypothetical protein
MASGIIRRNPTYKRSNIDELLSDEMWWRVHGDPDRKRVSFMTDEERAVEYPLPTIPPRSQERIDQPNFVLPPDSPTAGVYVLHHHGRGTHKIGCSTNLENRIRDIRKCIDDVTSVACVIFHAPPRQLEKALHKHFQPQRVHGEWFRLAPADLEWLAALDPVTFMDAAPSAPTARAK